MPVSGFAARREIPVPIVLGERTGATATLSLPATVAPGERLPALLVFGGFESAGQVLSLLAPVKGAAVALASFDYPFSAPRKLEFPGSLSALPEARALYPSTVLGILSLIDELKKRPEIDPDRIVLIGASFGAPFVLGAAARSASAAGVVIVQGFGRMPETAEHALMRSWGRRYGSWMRPAAWLLSRALWLYLGIPSPEDSARSLGPEKRVFVIASEEDSFIPRESSESLWEAVRSSRARARLETMSGGHLMPGSETLIASMIARVEAWMRSEKLLARP
jgi:dienelactone hydrolase